MKINSTKSKIKITAIIIGIVLFALILPNFVYAIDIGKTIIRAISYAVLNFFGIFVHIAAWFLEQMLNIAFSSQRVVVETGWGVIRDFSNMFFILFMVIIAFATILRIERYGIKELLPKVIIIALLINFSLVICYMIIDVCDIAAHYFINEAKGGINPATGRANRSIAEVLIMNLNLTRVMSPADCSATYEEEMRSCSAMAEGDARNTCEDNAMENQITCAQQGERAAATQSKEANFWNMIVSIILGSIVLMVAAFVMFVGGILLVVRIIFLWFLVMIVPFVFLCYLMPALQGNWKKWWKTFLNWCFFGPIFAFFIWLTVMIAAEARLSNITALSQGAAGNQQLGTSFFSSGNFLLTFIFLIGILVAGLIAAKNLGIYGADAALKIGKGMAEKFTGAKKVKEYIAARKKVREEEKKAAVTRGMRLREIGGVRQKIKESLPGEFGRRARARKAEVIQSEASRMLKNYRFEDLRRVMGYRGFTGFRRTSRLAASRAASAAKYSSQRITMSTAELNRYNQRIATLLRKYGITPLP